MKYKAIWQVVGIICGMGLVMILIGFDIGGYFGALIASVGIAMCIGATAQGHGEVDFGLSVVVIGRFFFGLFVNFFVRGFVGGWIGFFVGWWSEKKKERIDSEDEVTSVSEPTPKQKILS